jgi:hypothetical protein
MQLNDTLKELKVEIVKCEAEADQDIAIACSQQNADCAPGEELCLCLGQDR